MLWYIYRTVPAADTVSGESRVIIVSRVVVDDEKATIIVFSSVARNDGENEGNLYMKMYLFQTPQSRQHRSIQT